MRPRSAKELAKRPGVPADRLYYHLHQMELARLVEVMSYRDLLPGVCPGCQDVVALAVSASAGTCYLGGISPRCLAADSDCSLLDVLTVYATHKEAEQDLLSEEYYASLEPPDLEVDGVPSWA